MTGYRGGFPAQLENDKIGRGVPGGWSVATADCRKGRTHERSSAPRTPRPVNQTRSRRSRGKILSDIEAELLETAAEVGRLSDAFDVEPGSRPGLDRLLQIVAVTAIVVVIVPASWLPALLVFTVMAGLPIAAGLAGHHGARDRHVDTDPED